MHGPGHSIGPTPPPFVAAAPRRSRSRTARVGLFLLRAVLALVPLATIGILAWIPLLRTAIVRRRVRDWTALGATAVLATAAFVLQGTAPSLESWQTDTGMSVLLTLAVACPIYFLVAELRGPAPQPAPQPAPPSMPFAVPPAVPSSGGTPPLVPLGQVQAELDELSALLHRQHGSS